MDENPRRRRWLAVGRTLLWSVAGALAGMAIGGVLGYRYVPIDDTGVKDSAGDFGFILGSLVQFCIWILQFVAVLIGGGGILGAIAGAVFSRLLPSLKRESARDPRDTP